MILAIPAKAEADKPGLLLLQDVDNNGTYGDHYIWFDHNGNLRTHTSKPTDQDSDGSVISGGATTTLNNLASVACSASLISDTDNTDDLGSASKQWKDLYINGTAHLDLAEADAANVGRTAGSGPFLTTPPSEPARSTSRRWNREPRRRDNCRWEMSFWASMTSLSKRTRGWNSGRRWRWRRETKKTEIFFCRYGAVARNGKSPFVCG